MMKKNIFKTVIVLFVALFGISLSGCNKTVTYAELLEQERESISKFLKYGGVYTADLPGDVSQILESGNPNIVSNQVPFYKLQNDVAMQVVDKGNGRKIKAGDRVYFRFLRVNLNTWADAPYQISMFDLNNGGVGNWYYKENYDYYFDYVEDYSVVTSQYYTYGLGIEYPLAHIYDGARVYLVVPSKVGFSESVSSVVPYLYLIEYNITKN
ncbi:MAG: DUF4827 family protein [Muribaculaceae bacterium]|nr:DUF4827 family protein [Muribaculaceae bacterium]